MQKITAAVTRLWNAGCLGKIAIGFIGLFIVSCCMVALAGRRAPQLAIAPTAIAIAPAAAPIPTTELTIAPTVTLPSPTLEPTGNPASPELTSAPVVPVVISGVAPIGAACPSDAPIKGNIVDRGPHKGDKIYHTPDSSSYKQTKPERCFATVADAEAAGFRAPAR